MRTQEEFEAGIQAARIALRSGPIETLAYIMDEDIEDIKRVCGSIDPDIFKPRRVKLT